MLQCEAGHNTWQWIFLQGSSQNWILGCSVEFTETVVQACRARSATQLRAMKAMGQSCLTYRPNSQALFGLSRLLPRECLQDVLLSVRENSC
jgi:hypothetical protein